MPTVGGYVKRRGRPERGSIPDALGMFRAEVRFYREIAPVAGVRVPACYQASECAGGTLLVLEDLSAWQRGGDPVAAAGLLAGMHRRWEGQAAVRWPWLRPSGAGSDLIERQYGRVWPQLAGRGDLPPGLVALGTRLAGRVAAACAAAGRAGPVTLVHGDASTANMRTGPAGELAFLDWEDVSAAPGAADLAWLLVSSVDPARWDQVIAAYGPAGGLRDALPAVMVQGLLSLADAAAGSPGAAAWISRLNEAARRVMPAG